MSSWEYIDIHLSTFVQTSNKSTFMEKRVLKKTGYTAAIAIMAFNMQSCKKYDDGPGFTLRSKKARLVGNWDIVQIGAETFPQNGYSIEFEFDKEGDFKYSYTYGTYSYTYAGTWDFSSDKEDLRLVIDGTVQTFAIKRLTNKEVWLEDETNEEWKLEAQ